MKLLKVGSLDWATMVMKRAILEKSDLGKGYPGNVRVKPLGVDSLIWAVIVIGI